MIVIAHAIARGGPVADLLAGLGLYADARGGHGPLGYWADEPELILVPGFRYVFMGSFRRFSSSGFAHDRGLLELLAVTDYPLKPNSRWIFPQNSDTHPKARRDQGLAPIEPVLGIVPADIVAGAALRGGGPLVEPRDRDHGYELGRAAKLASDPRRAFAG